MVMCTGGNVGFLPELNVLFFLSALINKWTQQSDNTSCSICWKKAMTAQTWKRFACPAASRDSSVTNHLWKTINPLNTKVVGQNATVPITVWWMVAPCVGLNFQLLFCGFSSRACTRTAFEGRRGECKTASVIFRQPGPSSLWCMKPCVSPRLQYVWAVFLTPFCCACCNVMYCQTGTDQGVNAGLKQLLSTSVRQISLAMVWCGSA